MWLMLAIASHLYAGLLFAEVMRVGYVKANIHPNKMRRDYPFVLFLWPLTIGYVVVKNWRVK